MTVSTTPRRAGPFTGNGATTTFPFEFKVFKTSHVAVFVSSGDEVGDRRLSLDADYSVALDKDAGGVVTLTAPLPVGDKLAIVSDVPYDQQMVLTNRGGFYPTVINDNADYQCAQIQQLVEKQARTLVVPVTSTETPEKVLADVLSGAARAMESASEAAESLSATQAIQGQVNEALDDATRLGEQVREHAETIEQFTAPIVENLDLLRPVSENAEDIAEAGREVEAIKVVSGALLTGSEIGWNHDFGYYGEDDTPHSIVGGTLLSVADNIESIKAVAQNLPEVLASRDNARDAAQSAESAESAKSQAQGYASDASIKAVSAQQSAQQSAQSASSAEASASQAQASASAASESAVNAEYKAQVYIDSQGYAKTAQVAQVDGRVDSVQAIAEQAKAIAEGRATGYVFDTVEAMNAWLSDEAHKALLNIGDPLYIRAAGVSDYWWDGSQAIQLEARSIDLTDYPTKTELATGLSGKVDKSQAVNLTAQFDDGTTKTFAIYGSEA